jgi:murein DD-endopeptidase MepM/ murein hydrolase activator NlpD
MKAFWSALYRYHRLVILLALLFCLAPQFTNSAPGVQETVQTPRWENQTRSLQDIPVANAQVWRSNIASESIVEATVEKSKSGQVEKAISLTPGERNAQPPADQVASSGSEQFPAGIQKAEPVLPATEPLRFTFPEAPPPLTTAWRPPLYPVPWAKAPQDHFYFIRPIAADDINWPLWDYRYGGVFFENVVHTGIDIVARIGTPVVAAGSGKVIWAGSGLYRGENDPDDPYGLAVAIQHDFSYQGEALYTIYGHMDRVDVVWGQIVEAENRT